MGLADKLKKVVAANFIEIAREDESGSGAKPDPQLRESGSGIDSYANPTEPVTSSWARPEAAAAPAPVVEAQTSPLNAGADASHWLKADSTEYEGVLSSDGAPDFDRLFRNAGDLPQVSCSADEAVRILAEMPAELPMRVRRLTARTTVDRLSQSNPSVLEDILSDAALKMMKIARLSEKGSEHADTLRVALDAEIAELEEKIALRRAAMAEIEQRQQTLVSSCRRRMGELNDVVLFFDHPDIANGATIAAARDVIAATETSDDTNNEDDLPPFMREDSVMKMLGLNGAKNGASSEAATAVG